MQAVGKLISCGWGVVVSVAGNWNRETNSWSDNWHRRFPLLYQITNRHDLFNYQSHTQATCGPFRGV